MLTNYNFNGILINKDVKKELTKGDKIVIIKNFPLSDESLISFINTIGIPIKEKRNNNRDSVFDVKILKQNNLFRSIANSNLDFPLHTDCADFKSVPNCIGLLCVRPANLNQGTSKFVFLNKALKKLSKDEIQELLTKKWNFRNQSKSILSFKSNKHIIYYDRITIESFSEIDNLEIMQLNKLDNLFEQNSFKIKLEKGDLVLFRNDLVLHGRTEIDKNSNRLMKRIRFDVN